MNFETLFSFKGRASRTDYWLSHLIILAASLMLLLGVPIVYVLGAFGVFFMFPVLIAWVICTCWISISVTVRRLHDRGKSAWWLLPYWLVPGALSSAGNAISGHVGLAVWSVGLLITIAVFVELGCLKGTAGSNGYGSDPAADGAAQPAAA